jgi:IPT/TIG domain-containing protein/fibronectin type III domain protein/FG-GAP repeat protein
MASKYSYADIIERPPAGHLSALIPRRRRTRLTILGIVLACLAGPLTSSLGPGSSGRRVIHVPDTAQRQATASLLRLSPVARGPISAALGGGEAAYRVSGLRAGNPAQRMRLGFSSRGVTLSSGPTHLSIALAGVGRGGALRPARPAAPLVRSNRVTYVRGALREWYVNGPLGLEQGFDLERRPAGGGNLTLAVALAGVSNVHLRDGDALLSGPGGTLRYGGLSATDAGGHKLHAWLGLEAGRLLIHVDDSGARYPVRIDPFLQQAVLTGGGEVGEGFFGYSVALSADGNTALIGGPGDHAGVGAAWVFVRAGGAWTQQGPKLTAEDEQGEGGFGSSAALSADGNTALIGGEGDDSGQGAAWIFTRSGGVWAQQGAKLTGGVEESGPGHLGTSVALSGDGSTALVGGPADGLGRGAAWIFTRLAGIWVQQGSKLSGAGEVGSGEVGAAVALSGDGDTALIGGPGDERGLGAAWVFTRMGVTWTQQGSKLASGVGSRATGTAVALSESGDTALVGAPGSAGGAGLGLIFECTGGIWAQGGLLIHGNNAKESLGVSVALSAAGDTALLSGAGSTGVSEFVHIPGGSWESQTAVLNEGSGSVAMSADASTVLIGGGATNGDVGAADVVVPTPSLLYIEPQRGPASGGTVVTIRGSDFAGASSVMFGSTPAASFTVDSAVDITAVSPPGASGTVEVTVGSPGGDSAPVRGGEFTYGPPPSAPTHVQAKAGEGEARVTFQPPPEELAAVTSYTVTASPGGAQESGSGDEIAVLGLKNGVTYTFTVTATDVFGTGPPSGPSNSVIPGQIALGVAKRLASGAVELTVELPGGGVLSAGPEPALATKSAEDTRVSSARRRSRRTSRHRASVKGGAPPVFIRAVEPWTVGAEEESTTLLIEPTGAALRELTRKQTITAPVQISFTPTGGQPSLTTTDVSFTRPGYSFESGSEGWTQAWGGLTAAASSARHHTGGHSLRITIHSESYSAVNATADAGSISESSLGLLQAGVTISMWVYRPAATPPVGFRAMVRVGGEWTECRSPEVRPRAGRWVRLSITVPSSARCQSSSGAENPEVHGVGVEIDDKGGVASGKSVYLDDVSW